jgi:hypothetical protein
MIPQPMGCLGAASIGAKRNSKACRRNKPIWPASGFLRQADTRRTWQNRRE